MAKKQTRAAAFVLFLIAFPLTVHAGPTTLSGTAHCTMPDLMEMETFPLIAAAPQTSAAPAPSARSCPPARKHEPGSEAREERMVVQSGTDNGQDNQVNTICAR